MQIIECDQGGELWHQSRCGAITASMFSVARERLKTGANKGDFSAKAKDYAFRVAVERISNQPLDEGFETWAMKRGHELEPMARFEHELETGVFVQKAGFVLSEDGKFGASADGLINEDGGVEYKCLVSPERLRNILLTGDISEFLDQIMGGMWLTGRAWWHFCLYCPALEPIGKQFWMRHVNRDDDYINVLEQDLIQFEKLVSQYEQTLRIGAAA